MAKVPVRNSAERDQPTRVDDLSLVEVLEAEGAPNAEVGGDGDDQREGTESSDDFADRQSAVMSERQGG
jgi:hypothetical protein